MTQKNQFYHDNKIFILSEDAPKTPETIIIFSRNYNDKLYEDYNKPIKINSSSGHVFYINQLHRYYLSSGKSYYGCYGYASKYHSSGNLFELLQNIISNINKPTLVGFKSHIDDAIKIIKKANHINCALTDSIDKVFSMTGVNNDNLYNKIELKSAKIRNDFTNALEATIDYIENSIRQFLKTNRIYAGFSFLRSEIKKLEYGFFLSSNHSDPLQATFYISHSYCCYCINMNKVFVDREGHLIKKIIESILLLLSHIDCLEPVLDIYQLHEDIHIEMDVNSLVRLIEALLKNSNIETLESAISKLKIMEPKHPLIEVANRNIRRARVFKQISKINNIDLSNIQVMEGIDFEKFLEDQFTKKGFKVERTKSSGDFGADLIIETASGTRGSIQAKRFKNKTNLKAVQEVVASLPHYAADFGIVIAVSGFFPSAIKLAESNNIELWDEDKLIRFLSGDISFSMLQE